MEKENAYSNHAKKVAYILYEQGEAFNPNYTAKRLAENLGIDTRVLSNVFSKGMGTTFPKYLNKLRIEKAMRLLKKDKKATMEEIGIQCGFKNRMSFYANFHKVLGITPKEYQDSKKRPPQTDVSVSCGKLTLQTLTMKFPEDTMWRQNEDGWQGYSQSSNTIYKIANGHRTGTKSVFPVTIISSVGTEQIEIENL